MVPYIESALEVRMVFGICGVICIMFTIFVCAYGILLRLNKKETILTVVCALIGIALFQGISDVENFRQYEYEPTVLITIIGRIPCIAVGAIMIFLTGVELLLYISLRKNRHQSVTAETIKESLDALPEGVCFATKNGTPILVNRTMNEICNEIMKSGVLNINLFWESLQQYKIDMEENTLRYEFKTTDGRVWSLKKKEIQVDGTEIQEIIAYNITKQHYLKSEIEKNNEILKQVNNKLRLINQEIEDVTMEKEILATKVRVHDDLGRALLMVRLCIEKNSNEKERGELLIFWNTIINVLNYETVDQYKYDWELIMKNAKDLGVLVKLNGDMPGDIIYRRIIIAIAKECLTNLVKHAGGNEMYIDIKKANQKLQIKVTNNGIKPKKKIIERGGLLNLRRLIEAENGEMIMGHTPVFNLNVTLPIKGEYNEKDKSNDC